MNRQIKFRGRWQTTSGKYEWEYGVPYTSWEGQTAILFQSVRGDEDYFRALSMSAREVDPSTIGQFTGLKDRNGKEIYEGDIVRISNRLKSYTKEIQDNLANMVGIQPPAWTYGGDEIARVSYFDCAFHFIILESYMPDSVGRQEPMLNYLFSERHPDAVEHYHTEIEIIGNIHDNKIKDL